MTSTPPIRPPADCSHSCARDRSAESLDPRVERTRLAVVDAAAQLLLEHGPDAITHAAVAAAAEVSRTTVYKHYPERSDLLFATAEAIGKNLPDPADMSGDLRSDLATLLSILATDLRDPRTARVMAMMMERAMHDDAVALVRDTFMREIQAAFATIVANGVATGELAPGTDTQLGLAALAGSLIYSRFLADLPIDDALVDGVIDHFIATNAPR